MRKRKLGLRRDMGALHPTGLCELEVVQLRRVLTMRDLPNDQHACDFPWSKGNASLLLFPLLFQLSQSKVSVWKGQSVTHSCSHKSSYQYEDIERSFLPFTFFCLFPCVTYFYFSSNGCLACHIWFKGNVATFGCRVSWSFHLSIWKSILTSRGSPMSS